MSSLCSEGVESCLDSLGIRQAHHVFKQYYSFEGDLVKGQFSSIRRCRHKTNERLGAVKIFDTSIQRRYDRNRMEREILILLHLRENGSAFDIVQFLEHVDGGRYHYVVFELLTGWHLFDDISGRDFYFEVDAATYAHQILNAVSFCHAKGIIHRDIRPENLMLNSEHPANATVKLIDFGCAIFRRTCGNCGFVGWPDNRAPEAFRDGIVIYGFEFDMWSCGVVIYNLLTGTAPFRERDGKNAIQSIGRGIYETGPFQWDGVSDDGKDLIGALLKVDPKERLTAEAALNSSFVGRRLTVDDRYTKNLRNAMIQMNTFTEERWVRAKERQQFTSEEIVELGLDHPRLEQNLPLVHVQEPLRDRQGSVGGAVNEDTACSSAGERAQYRGAIGATNATVERETLPVPVTPLPAAGNVDRRPPFPRRVKHSVKKHQEPREICSAIDQSEGQHVIPTVSKQVMDSEVPSALENEQRLRLQLPVSHVIHRSAEEDNSCDFQSAAL